MSDHDRLGIGNRRLIRTAEQGNCLGVQRSQSLFQRIGCGDLRDEAAPAAILEVSAHSQGQIHTRAGPCRSLEIRETRERTKHGFTARHRQEARRAGENPLNWMGSEGHLFDVNAGSEVFRHEWKC